MFRLLKEEKKEDTSCGSSLVDSMVVCGCGRHFMGHHKFKFLFRLQAIRDIYCVSSHLIVAETFQEAEVDCFISKTFIDCLPYPGKRFQTSGRIVFIDILSVPSHTYIDRILL